MSTSTAAELVAVNQATGEIHVRAVDEEESSDTGCTTECPDIVVTDADADGRLCSLEFLF